MQDLDFQERMYAKQIAVMKGQAWNVVETLKTEGHGPLELTRRARVCVWDDLVDVPTVIPLGRPSVEQSARRIRRKQEHQEEMDISAAGGSAPETAGQDLLGPSTPPKMEAQSPFNVSRQNSSMDVRPPMTNVAAEPIDLDNGPLSPTNLESFTAHHSPSPERKKAQHSQSYHSPSASTSKSSKASVQHRPRMSFEVPRLSGTRHQRRYSLGVGGWNDDGDGDEGDLGFAATEEREGNRVQVVVERLETVKGRRPFFTWC
jgi:hypothetical protein